MLIKTRTCTVKNNKQIISCDLGLISDGRFADFFPALKILAIRFVFVSRAA